MTPTAWNQLWKWVLLCVLAMCAPLAWAKNNQYGTLAYHDVVDEAGSIYHQVKTSEQTPKSDILKAYYPQTISKKTLISHFNWLKSNGYNVVSWQDILDSQTGKKTLPDKAVLLTFDDGYESFYRIVYPLLKEYNYPAVFAVVTSLIDQAPNSMVVFGDTRIARGAFVTWPQIKEMSDSGLVEIASHTHNLHRAIKANPGGSAYPAVFSAQYSQGRYENPAEYHQRLQADFKLSGKRIKQHTGKFPDVLVWPYGQFNDHAWKVANGLGYKHHFTLHDERINPKLTHDEVGRFLIEEETLLETLSEYLSGRLRNKKTERVMHVDLDYVYDTNPQQMAKNTDALIERVYQSGATTVYLQAYADEDGNGVAEKLYFPNRHLPVKKDLFGQIAWQLMTRANVKVYAWMPVMGFDLGPNADYVKDTRMNKPNPEHYLRLNPYNPANLKIINEIYADLSFHSKFNGLLFHDDAFLTDFEGPISGKRDDTTLNQEAEAKSQYLIQLTKNLEKTVSDYSYRGNAKLMSARNIYAQVIINPQAKQWFAQDYQAFLNHYDRTAIMAMPYMEAEQTINAQTAKQWLKDLLVKANVAQNNDKLVFELQARNWKTEKAIPEAELNQWFDLLRNQGVYHFGYYPDDLAKQQPELKQIRPHFSAATAPKN